VQVQVSGTCMSPQITKQPATTTHVAPGESATLDVIATGTPVLKYEWFEGPVGETSKPVGSDSPLFVTPPLTGMTMYWIRVSNACGETRSNAALVVVGSGKRRTVRS
jgi:Ig-like domain CHU_C associated